MSLDCFLNWKQMASLTAKAATVEFVGKNIDVNMLCSLKKL